MALEYLSSRFWREWLAGECHTAGPLTFPVFKTGNYRQRHFVMTPSATMAQYIRMWRVVPVVRQRNGRLPSDP